ncbi:hypothetical protein IWQ57_004412, partial [Coemansia nantahalensis]
YPDRDSLLVDVVGDGRYSPGYGLPPIAGTRPPPISGPDFRLNSPAYAAPPPPPAVGGGSGGAGDAQPPVKVKLKLKMGKAAQSSTVAPPPARTRSPSFSSQSPHYSTLPRISSPLATSPAYMAPEAAAAGGWSPVYSPPEASHGGSPSWRRSSSALQGIAGGDSGGGGAAAGGLSGAARKTLHRILRKICKHQAAFPFLRPVDVVLDGCPTYYDIIKHPMDLGTIKMKLEAPAGYLVPSAFEADVRLMFANCYAFNPAGTPVHDMGRAVEALFDAEWAKAALSDAASQAGAAKRKSAPKTVHDAAAAAAGGGGAAPNTPKRQKKSVDAGGGGDDDGLDAGDGAAAALLATPAGKGAKAVRTASTTKARSKKADATGARAKAVRKRSAGQLGSLAAVDAAGLGALDDPDAIMEYLDRAGGSAGGGADADSGASASVGGDWRTMCRRVLLRIQAQKSALEFMAPVDPIRQGVPTYFDVIKQPMDLGTIRKNLERNVYQSADGFRDHVQLVLSNCFLFNPPGAYVHDQALALQREFEAAWRHQSGADVAQTPVPTDAIPRDLPLASAGAAALERARAIVNRMKRDDCAWPFLRPVDPVALGVPTYFDIVRNPMDLSTVQKKLAKKAYPAVADFVADIQLIVDDCFLFNLPDTPVHGCGLALRALAASLLEEDGWGRWLAPE